MTKNILRIEIIQYGGASTLDYLKHLVCKKKITEKNCRYDGRCVFTCGSHPEPLHS